METTEVVDEARLREAAGGLEELEIDLLELLVTDGRERLEALITAIAAGDAPAARREAHTLKGASSSVGANSLSTIARSAEEECVAGDLDAVQVDLLRAELERVNAYLQSRR